MKFKDAPIGARFKQRNGNGTIWVKLNSYPKGRFESGNGLICEWKGNVPGHQQFALLQMKILGLATKLKLN
ncbi:MAG: hypothetical protein IPL70_09235 [Uliginosibacterium sp.]|nr:hypothetical protein [Uliginosibacterium sp.]